MRAQMAKFSTVLSKEERLREADCHACAATLFMPGQLILLDQSVRYIEEE